MKSRSVGVTGATGFLGWHIAGAFRSRGWNVRAIVRLGNLKPVPPDVEAVESPLDAAPLARAFAGCDAIVHAAALTRAPDERAFEVVNVDGTAAVVAAANATSAALIFISSLGAAGAGTPVRPVREDDAPRPVVAYGRSKLADEAVVRTSALVPWTILRPSAVYGPRDRQMLPLFRLAERGQLWLAARPGSAFTMTYAEDVARAVVMAAEDPRAAGQTLFVGHPDPQTEEAILRQIALAFGRSAAPRRTPRVVLRVLGLAGDLAWRLGRPPLLDAARLLELQAEGWVCAVDRARDVIGFTAETPLAEGLERTLRWYRQQRWI
jgi:nucleoside-diphosphate-sugar epimerase